MATGDLIRYNDLSALRNTLNSILNGSAESGGYNQGHSITANPAVGDLIDDAYQDSIFAAAAKLANYYNITNPFAAVNAGDIVNWADYAEDAATFVTAIQNRHDKPWIDDQSWIPLNDWDVATTSVGSSTISDWNGTKTFEFTMEWGSQAEKWAWFNAGGRIHVALGHDSTVDLQAESWSTLLNTSASLTLFGKFDGYASQISDGTSEGAYQSFKTGNIGSTYRRVYRRYSADSYYDMNYHETHAYQTTTKLHVKVVIADDHTGSYSGAGTDIVSGTTTATVYAVNLDNTAGSVVINNPTFTAVSNF